MIALLAELARAASLDAADPRERLLAVRALAVDPAALETLAAYMVREPEPELRAAAQDALARLPLTTAALVAALDSPVPAARAFAAHALGSEASPEAVAGLLSAIDDSEALVREHVYAALADTGDRAALPTLVKAAVREPHTGARAAAARAAEVLAAAPSVPFDTPAAVARLRSSNPSVREAAARDLGELGDRRAVDALCVLAADPTDVPTQRAAVTALGRLGDARAVPTLLATLAASEGRTRHATLGALANLRDESTADAVTTYLDDGDVSTRQLAVRALAWIAPPDLFARLEPAQRDAVESVRGEVLFAAGESRAPERIAALRRALADPSPFLRAEAARLAGEAGMAGSLLPLLDDSDALVRLAAADTLAALAPEGAAAALTRAAGRAATPDERRRLEQAAERAGAGLAAPSPGR